MTLLTSTELAAELGLSIRSIQRYVKAGQIEPDLITPGGHYRFDPERVREQLRELARAERERE